MRFINGRAGGFTLLEVLIAMSLLGIMLVLLFGSFTICSKSWNAGEEHLYKVEQMALVQNFFRSHLTSAWSDSGPQRAAASEDGEAGSEAEAGSENAQGFRERAFFQGQQQYLQFVSLLPESAARGGWYLFKVGIAPRSTALHISMSPFLPQEEEVQSESENLEILPDLETLGFAYWGTKEGEDTPQWHEEWVDMPALPELVSISIKLRGQSPWPELVVAPQRAPLHVNLQEAPNAGPR